MKHLREIPNIRGKMTLRNKSPHSRHHIHTCLTERAKSSGLELRIQQALSAWFSACIHECVGTLVCSMLPPVTRAWSLTSQRLDSKLLLRWHFPGLKPRVETR